MLEFFSKKHYLADQLENFVDIHNHILPGIDDGAEDPGESIALIREFESMGIQKFVATPHILRPLYPNTPETIRESHGRLMDALLEEGMTSISVEPAAEHMIDDSFESMLEAETFMPIRDTYLLVEMSFLQPPLNFDEAIIAVNKKRLSPILAHPERYMFLHRSPAKYQHYREQGILLQLNLLSLTGHYGADIQRMALKLLDQDMIDFVATDIHNLRHCKALKECRLRSKQYDQLVPLIQRSIETFY